MSIQLNCTGQSPCSELLTSLSPQSISSNGYVKVKPTLQIAGDEFPNVYACGEITDTETPCPNARSAMRQAATVARNVLRVADGKKPKYVYKHHWVDTFIKLTLGLVCSAGLCRCEDLTDQGTGSFCNLHGRWTFGFNVQDQGQRFDNDDCIDLVTIRTEAV